MQSRGPVFIFLVLFCILISEPGKGQKVDTIYHINGNVLTGDFRKLNYGIVTWKMQGMGTISLETPNIENIKSNKVFEIKLKSGFIYFGSFDTSYVDRMVKLVITNGTVLVSIDDIVEAYPIRRSFWLRTTGNLSLGLNYSKGSDVASLAFSGNMEYRKRKSAFKINWNNNNTFQADTLSATNVNVGLSFERNLQNYWLLGTEISGSQNSQLGYRLRLNYAAAAIRDIVYNSWNRYNIAVGLSLQRETPFGESVETTTDLAGIVATGWKVYKYTNPKFWVDSDLTFFPYITGETRYRVDLNMKPKVGIVDNTLQIGLNFYYSYDSRPAVDATSSFDWGIYFELTYSLH